MTKSMMGERVEKQMHISWGKRSSGCVAGETGSSVMQPSVMMNNTSTMK